MKIRPDKNQLTWSVTIFGTAAAVLLFYCLLFRASSIAAGFRALMRMMSPILYGIVIALIMSPLLNAIETSWLKPHYRKKENAEEGALLSRKSLRRMRKISVFLTEALLILVFILLILIIVPQTIKSLQDIADHITMYLENANQAISGALTTEHFALGDFKITAEMKSTLLDFTNKATEWLNTLLAQKVLPNTSSILKQISSGVVSFIKGFFNIIIGIIVSAYLLYSKESMAGQFKKIAYAVFRDRHANIIIGEFRYIQRTFVGFISGKILDSIIIGILCYIGTRLIGTPYALLVSVFIGVTNIIPFFGPYIGAIFGLAIIVLINPLQALYFLLFVLALQQFDGNILGPKILGDSTGLSSFWVIFSIMFFGGLFGVAGWIIGVPIFAVGYHWADKLVTRKLQAMHLPSDTGSYIDTAYIEHGTFHSLLDETDNRYQAVKLNNPWKKLAFWNAAARSARKSDSAPGPDKADKQDQNR